MYKRQTCGASKLEYVVKGFESKVHLVDGRGRVTAQYRLIAPVERAFLSQTPSELFNAQLPVCWPNRGVVLSREFKWHKNDELGWFPGSFDGVFATSVDGGNRMRVVADPDAAMTAGGDLTTTHPLTAAARARLGR